MRESIKLVELAFSNLQEKELWFEILFEFVYCILNLNLMILCLKTVVAGHIQS